jgi:hypothetical protein
MYMKRHSWVLAVLLLVSAGTAVAGFKTGQQVVISTTSRFANADIGYVHNTPDTTQYIGCEVYAYTTQLYAYCYARDLAGTYAGCSTSNVNLVNAAASINPDSYLLFYWDAAGACTFIAQHTQSQTATKAP